MFKSVMFVFLLLLVPLVAGAVSLSVVDEGSVVVAELDNPARYSFTINAEERIH